jgi:hypothetical protein|tara:strand:+ start:4014 stop:4508 length:495 start_codon:yes stop_codon:yes gene_type:complete
VKPRYDAISYEAAKLLEKAQELEQRIEKAQPGFKSEPMKESVPHFVSETGGQTQNQHFTTNQRTLETEDAPKPKNKKAKESVSMEGLGRRLNPHEGTGAEREDATGDAKPLDLSKGNEFANRREAAEGGHAPQICGKCGGTTREGCRIHQGMDLNACHEYRPLQ